jgi:hypothetical protein
MSILDLFLVWRWFKRSYVSNLSQSNRGKQLMKLGDYNLVFVDEALIRALLIASPAFAGAIHRSTSYK